MHGKDGCVEDVDVVDLFVCCPSHTPCQGVALYDRPELLALMLGEFLGVVEQGIGVAIGKYNRRQPRPASSHPASRMNAVVAVGRISGGRFILPCVSRFIDKTVSETRLVDEMSGVG